MQNFRLKNANLKKFRNKIEILSTPMVQAWGAPSKQKMTMLLEHPQGRSYIKAREGTCFLVLRRLHRLYHKTRVAAK